MIDKDTLWTIDHTINDGAETMVIISKCPHCGAPLYAPNLWVGDTPPPVIHTCECRFLSAISSPRAITEDDSDIPNYTKLPLATSP